MIIWFFFLMTSAIVVPSRAVGGTYLKVTDATLEIYYSYGLFCLLLVLKKIVFLAALFIPVVATTYYLVLVFQDWQI